MLLPLLLATGLDLAMTIGPGLIRVRVLARLYVFMVAEALVCLLRE